MSDETEPTSADEIGRKLRMLDQHQVEVGARNDQSLSIRVDELRWAIHRIDELEREVASLRERASS